MKKVIASILFLIFHTAILACPVCERQKPKALRGITHGVGPGSNWDYLIVWITIVITILTLFFTIKWLLKPGEKNKTHIKYAILN